MPIPKRSASPRPDVDTAALVSLKVLDPFRPIREADIDQVAVTIGDFIVRALDVLAVPFHAYPSHKSPVGD